MRRAFWATVFRCDSASGITWDIASSVFTVSKMKNPEKLIVWSATKGSGVCLAKIEVTGDSTVKKGMYTIQAGCCFQRDDVPTTFTFGDKSNQPVLADRKELRRIHSRSSFCRAGTARCAPPA